MNDMVVHGELTPTATAVISTCLKNLQRLENEKKMLMDALQGAMEENGIRSFENNHLKITYIDETDVEMFDKKLFREEHPTMYDEYVKMSPRKAYVKVTVK